MLAVTSYPRRYVATCRTRFHGHVAAFQLLRKSIAAATGTKGRSAMPEVNAFEAHYFNNLLLALDAHFLHRARGQELKDGNPLNEVRMVCASLTAADGVLAADTTIRYDPARTILGLAIGDAIALTEADFVRLSEAFLQEIEKKFGGAGGG